MEAKDKAPDGLLHSIEQIEALGLCPGYDRRLLEAAFRVAGRLKEAQADIAEIVKEFLCGQG